MAHLQQILQIAILLLLTSSLELRQIFSASTAKPVRVSVYYEALCPDSIRFIKEQLWPTYNALKSSGIMDVFLYAYGNANQTFEKEMWTFSCQHGESECALNTLETCVEFIHPTPEIFLPYIYCVEVEDKPSVYQAKKCAEKYHLNWMGIKKCSKGKLGNQLEHVMGLKTDALDPKHTFIPWIVVNEESDKDIQKGALNNLKQLVCAKYTGTKPDSCKNANNKPDSGSEKESDEETNF